MANTLSFMYVLTLLMTPRHLDILSFNRGKQISFGSFFGPSDPAKLWAVLDVIMEKGIPFVSSID